MKTMFGGRDSGWPKTRPAVSMAVVAAAPRRTSRRVRSLGDMSQPRVVSGPERGECYPKWRSVVNPVILPHARDMKWITLANVLALALMWVVGTHRHWSSLEF